MHMESAFSNYWSRAGFFMILFILFTDHITTCYSKASLVAGRDFFYLLTQRQQVSNQKYKLLFENSL